MLDWPLRHEYWSLRINSIQLFTPWRAVNTTYLTLNISLGTHGSTDHDKSKVSCQEGHTRHAYAWQIGPFRQDTLEICRDVSMFLPCATEAWVLTTVLGASESDHAWYKWGWGYRHQDHEKIVKIQQNGGCFARENALNIPVLPSYKLAPEYFDIWLMFYDGQSMYHYKAPCSTLIIKHKPEF